MEQISEIRERLSRHLQGGEAFTPVEELLTKIHFEKLGERPGDLPYSFYELFYHVWFTQKDILNYCLAKTYVTPRWPRDYWPKEPAPQSRREWEDLQARYFTDRQEISQLVLDSRRGLMDAVRANSDHSLLREILLIIEHTAYHTGQMLVLLRHLGLHSP